MSRWTASECPRREAAECASGWCAWCERSHAVDWLDHGHKWADGSAAPLCGDCSPVFSRRGGSLSFWDDQRAGLAEAMTGVPLDLGEAAPALLTAYAETDDQAGTGQPWSHLPRTAVEAFRWDMWARSGGQWAPEEHRAEALARLAERAAARADHESARVAKDRYGFAAQGESRDA